MAEPTIAIRKFDIPSRQLDLAGMVFGRLRAIVKTDDRVNKRVMWRCVCECGREATVSSSNLRNGHAKSCGCLQREAITKHGLSHTVEYNSWCGMIDRCTNREHISFPRYGGRGISVCDRWQSFDRFLEDMGQCPPGLTIERTDNERGYSPDNCKWATKKEQGRNRSTNRMLTFNGETKCLVEWAERAGLTFNQLHDRLRLNWPIERALTTPARAPRPRR